MCPRHYGRRKYAMLDLNVELKPLDSKYYETELVLTFEHLPNPIYIRLAGRPTGYPSEREIENGWEPEYGMDHVEDELVYQVALSIKDYLEC
jgi:hypothetical protein